MPLYENIASVCKELEKEFDTIPDERKEALLSFRAYLSLKLASDHTPKTIFVCTHNSRRSQIAQIWMAVAIDYYQLPPMKVYSGGTESTAFNIRAVKAFQRIGFSIRTDKTDLDNPVYRVRWNSEMDPYPLFSKKYNHPSNPKEAFAAIMVCSAADEACPFVTGCDYRLSLPYDDPKDYDDMDVESQKYNAAVRDIGHEMLFVLSGVVEK